MACSWWGEEEEERRDAAWRVRERDADALMTLFRTVSISLLIGGEGGGGGKGGE